MIGALLASSGGFAAPAPLLIALIAGCVLVGLRAWIQTAGVLLARRVSLLLDGTILALVVLFGFLVIVRFEILA